MSKVLRNSEKYLNPDINRDQTISPIKRNKVKGRADIERALTNYVRNAQKSGIPVTDADIKEKARLFSATTGKPDDNLTKVTSSSWLEKFKQKNGIRLMRRASETSLSDSMRHSPSLSASQLNSAISPSSPSVHHSPSPLSANRSEDGKDGLAGYLDFNTKPGSYNHSNSQSTTSLSSAFSAESAISSNGPFSFSPHLDSGAFQPLAAPGLANFQRPRSQTFPTLDLEYMNQSVSSSSQNTEPLTPRYHVSSAISSTAPSSALESSAHEMPQLTFGLIDQQSSGIASSPHHQQQQQLRRSSSNNSLGRGSSVVASSSSPSQEDARRAADTLLSFIQNSRVVVDPSEYYAVIRLTEKLRLHQQSSGGMDLGGGMAGGMGGLDRIPERGSGMGNKGELGASEHHEGQHGGLRVKTDIAA